MREVILQCSYPEQIFFRACNWNNLVTLINQKIPTRIGEAASFSHLRENVEVSREEYNPPASLMQNMSNGWLLTATLQPLYASLQGAHCKQWHFTAAPAALWNSCRHWSSCYWGLFLGVFRLPPRPPRFWPWTGLVRVISDWDGKRVVARRTGKERREGQAAGKAGDLGFVVVA